MNGCVRTPMKKYSKSDQDPKQIHADHEGIQKILSKKSPHFTVGTYVIRNNVRGLITAITKDGGSKLWVEWDDGTAGPIDNPRYFRRWQN